MIADEDDVDQHLEQRVEEPPHVAQQRVGALLGGPRGRGRRSGAVGTGPRGCHPEPGTNAPGRTDDDRNEAGASDVAVTAGRVARGRRRGSGLRRRSWGTIARRAVSEAHSRRRHGRQPREDPSTPMSFRARQTSNKSHTWDDRDRRSMLLNIGFAVTVVVAVVLLLVAFGVSWYSDHLASAGSVNGQTITRDAFRKQFAINAFRNDYQNAPHPHAADRRPPAHRRRAGTPVDPPAAQPAGRHDLARAARRRRRHGAARAIAERDRQRCRRRRPPDRRRDDPGAAPRVDDRRRPRARQRRDRVQRRGEGGRQGEGRPGARRPAGRPGLGRRWPSRCPPTPRRPRAGTSASSTRTPRSTSRSWTPWSRPAPTRPPR